MTKGKAFVLCYAGIMVIFLAMFSAAVASGDYTLAPVPVCLTALCTLSGGYIGFNVLNNSVRGKNFNPDLWDRENGEKTRKEEEKK